MSSCTPSTETHRKLHTQTHRRTQHTAPPKQTPTHPINPPQPISTHQGFQAKKRGARARAGPAEGKTKRNSADARHRRRRCNSARCCNHNSQQTFWHPTAGCGLSHARAGSLRRSDLVGCSLVSPAACASFGACPAARCRRENRRRGGCSTLSVCVLQQVNEQTWSRGDWSPSVVELQTCSRLLLQPR